MTLRILSIEGEENRKKWDTYQPLDVVRNIIGDIDGLLRQSY
jgi:hypothetical protein